MPIRYIEIDSSFRDRTKGPPGQFTMKTNAYNTVNANKNAIDPVSDEVIISKWRNDNFMVSAGGGIRTKGIHLIPFNQTILSSDTTSYPASEGNNLILSSIVDINDSSGNGGLQPHKNYYYGAVLSVDFPMQSTRIINYEYLGSNKCSIRTESAITLSSTSSVQIIDPSTITDSLRSPKDQGFIFVPYGPPQKALTGSYLINITTNTEYTITYHHKDRNMIKISDDYIDSIGDFDELEIRERIPLGKKKREDMSWLTDYPMTGATRSDVYNTIGFKLTSGSNQTTNISEGDFIEIQKDNEHLTGVLAISSQNKHIDLNASVTGASSEKNAYIGSTLRLICTNTSAPFNYTSEDRIVTSYQGGLASLTLPAYITRSVTYTDAPTVTISGGGGSGAIATAHLPAFTLNKISPVVTGSGYTTATVTISAPTGSEPRVQAVATANIVGTAITSYTITEPGRGYLTAPTITITGDGTLATATATIYTGALANPQITTIGQEYPSAASSISVIVGKPDHPDGTQAQITLTITTGTITGIVLTNPGSGYTKIPSLTIQSTRGADGVIAVDLAAATGGGFVPISWLTIDNPGTGYTSNPTVAITGAETATATFSPSIITVNEPYDNRLTSYSGGINAVIFTPTEAKQIVKKVDMQLPPALYTRTGPQIDLTGFSFNPTDDVNKNGFLTGFYVAIKYSGDIAHYGYIKNHVVAGLSSIGLPLTNYIEVDADFDAYMAALPANDVYIVGVKLASPFTRNPYLKLSIGTDRMSVLTFGRDNHGVLSQKNGYWPTGKTLMRYVVSLMNIVLPNKPMLSGKGGYITEYPFVYVRFQNSSSGTDPGSGGVVTNDQLYSNNPLIHGKAFRVIVDNTVDDQTTNFVTLRPNDMNQTQILHFNQDIDFAVFLPDGSLFQTYETDTESPYPPIKDIQISALFSLIPESET